MENPTFSTELSNISTVRRGGDLILNCSRKAKVSVLLISCCVLLCPNPTEAAFEPDSSGRYPIIWRTCLNNSVVSERWTLPRPAVSILQCLIVSRTEQQLRVSGVKVVQLDTRDSTCSVFLFSRVCHLLNLSSPAVASTIRESNCETIVDSELDALVANRHFAAVWLGGRGPQLENLVCDSQGPRNPVEHAGVDWTGEGARMDGETSRMWLNGSEGLEFNTSLTWLIELKRTPKAACFIEMTDCNSFNEFYYHFWEFDYSTTVDIRRLYFSGKQNLNSKHMILPAKADHFFITGAAIENSELANKAKLFFNGDYLPHDEVDSFNQSMTVTKPHCLKYGWRSWNGPEGKLNGTIKMIALANSFLPADVALQLFPMRSP